MKVCSERGLDGYSLSPLQQGMLAHSLASTVRGVDVEQVVCELHEEIDAGQFEKAWQAVVARHPILRTSFHWEAEDEPQQTVHAAADVRLPFHYGEFGSEQEARQGLEEYLTSDRATGFDPAVAPLVRVALIRGGPEHYWFVTTFHHLVLDGRAMVTVFREALDLHDALVAGERVEWAAPAEFRDYIAWLKTLDSFGAEKFWRGQLKGYSAPTTLPLARTSPDETQQKGVRGELALRFASKAVERMRDAAKRYDVTVNTLVQGAWAVLLSRYSGEEEVVFGAVRACRHIPVAGAESMVGLLINTLPMRVSIEPEVLVGSWLQKMREQWLKLRDFEHTSLAKIQRWSEIPAGRSLFETMVNYQEPSWDAALAALGGKWAHRQFEIRSQPSFPLALDVCGGATMTATLIYDRRRFSDEAMSRMLGHFRVVLEAMADDPPRTVGALPMLTEFETHQTLVEWNRTSTEYPRDRSVAVCVEANAREHPGRLAVADAKGSLNYGELNCRANRVAARLRAAGVGRGELVAVCMRPTVEMVVAWLAVVKAGGAFVPLDASSPRERLAFQLEDCAARVLLTQPELRGSLPPLPGISVLDVHADGSGFEMESDQDLGFVAGPDDLAYVIYTSGSTGRPKGVEITHGALTNLVSWHRAAYRVMPDDRASQLASPAFDAAVWEIWPYLAVGASVHLVDDETRRSPRDLVRWLAEKRITLAFLPTPLAEATMDEEWPKGTKLRAMLTGGDKLKGVPPDGFPCALFNHYGPTENAVVTSWGEVARGEPGAAEPAIGRPIANVRVYVLDAHRRPLPVGLPGELFIGGDSLARGYLNRPELTTEKFLPLASRTGAAPEKCHLLNDTLSERVYRTGDMVRWRADGQLEFVGRRDGQVKIRGFRIELGEIENVLQRHPDVREALVLAPVTANGETQLVAYVHARETAVRGMAEALTEFLRRSLPAHMVPAAFVFLNAWPLTTNGKIDREALPAPDDAAKRPTVPSAAPRGNSEQVVARTYAEVLGCGAVGRDDNFFTLGGHSLLAAQLVSRLNRALGGALSVRDVFEQPTVAGLAQALARTLETKTSRSEPAPRVVRRVRRPEMELVPPN